jgi:alginate O-acetyltransferase complex protein AlgJ
MSQDNTSSPGALRAIGVQNLLAASVLLVVMVLGFWQMLAGSRGIDYSTVPQGWDNFWEGKTTQTLEKRLDHAVPARPTLIMLANAARYWITRGAGAKVRVGDENWLFLTEELQVDAGAGERLAPRLALLADTHRALESRGIASVILLVPDKARVHAEALGARRAQLVDQRYALALEGLRADGVPVIDLLADMQAARAGDPALELYYRTDTHWNPSGAEIAAKAVAAWSAANRPLSSTADFDLRRDGDSEERVGDLLALIGLDQAPAWLRPQGDWETPVVVEARAAASADAFDDLFAETSVPVVLLGTSYSQRAAFDDFLRLHLGSEVLNAAKDGGRIAGAAQDYFADDAFRDTPPQLVVWEVPERFLTLPMDAGQTEPATLLPAP